MLVDSSRLFALIGLQIAWKEIGGGTLEIYVVSGLGEYLRSISMSYNAKLFHWFWSMMKLMDFGSFISNFKFRLNNYTIFSLKLFLELDLRMNSLVHENCWILSCKANLYYW